MDTTNSIPVINMDALNRATEECRQQLDHNPDDMENRVQLAWCLFLLAVLGASKGNGVSNDSSETSHSTWDTQKALTDCLRETFTVMQLSMDKADHIRVATLQSLVKMLCGTQVFSHAEQEATTVVIGLIQEIFAEDTKSKHLSS
jgi:hypothetical protein